MNDFDRTGMGQKFFEATLPNLVRQIARLADGVERAVRLLEEERASAIDMAKGRAE